MGVWSLFNLSGQVKIIPTNDAVFDEAVAGLCDFLFFLFHLGELTGVADGHGAGETVGQLNLVELTLDSLAQGEIVDVTQDEQGFDDLSKCLQSLINCVLA